MVNRSERRGLGLERRTQRTRRAVVARRALVTSAALAGAAGAAWTRWSTADDPTGGQPLDLPAGDDFRVETPDGASLAARACGPEGRAHILLLHGWTADKRVWAATVRRLVAAGLRVVVYDQRGHGESTLGDNPLDITTLASDLRVVLESIDAHDVVVGGHSLGGMVVQRFAIEHKEVLADRVASLILISTAAADVVMGGPYARWADWMAGSAAADTAMSHPVIGPYLVRMTVGRRPVRSHLEATAETFVATPRPVRCALLGAISGLDLTGGLDRITAPTVVVSGTLDALTLPARSRQIASLVPGARLIVIPSAGHQLVFEAPDRLAEIIGGQVATSEPLGGLP